MERTAGRVNVRAHVLGVGEQLSGLGQQSPGPRR